MKFFDLFSGIGGFRLGMEAAGHECIGFCEIDKFARSSYKAIHDTEGEIEYHDITKVTDNEWRQLKGKVDILCGGFPCQAFSIAGKRRGFEEARGTLFFEIARAAQQIEPRLLLLENVKGLLSHDQGKTFGVILNALDELGYDAEWAVLNSKDHGVPQNRERVFIIGHSRRYSRREVFPLSGTNSSADIQRVVDGRRDHGHSNYDVYSTNGLSGTVKSRDFKDPMKVAVVGDIKSPGFNQMTARIYDKSGISPALQTMQGGGLEPKIAIPVLTPDRTEKRQNGRRFKEDGGPSFTVTSQDRHGVLIKNNSPKTPSLEATNGDNISLQPKARGSVRKGYSGTVATQPDAVLDNFRIRKLTPRECWRLQGFPDWVFDKAQAVNSNTQLYKQAGNSVTVPVIYAIARSLR